MPKVKPLTPKLKRYLAKRNLNEKFDKQIRLIYTNPKHPSLNLELLEPRERGIYSFRVDRKYRAIFVYWEDEIVIIDINAHYK